MSDYPLVRKSEPDCVFCTLVAEMPDHVEYWPMPHRSVGVVQFAPLNPVTPGHMLFVPTEHVPDAAASPEAASVAMEAAAQYCKGMSANIITSIGTAATQSVFHLHVHVVPRKDRDGLPLPWTPQQQAERRAKSLSEYRVDPEELCWSQGPRIGSEGYPVCKKPRDHHLDGKDADERRHQGFDGSGFESVGWGSPLMRLPKNQRF